MPASRLFEAVVAFGLLRRQGTSASVPSVRSPVHLADLVIIGIEQEPEDRTELPVARKALAQQEILEEPRRVGQVSLRRTDIRHALDNKVLRLERARQLECERARIAVTLRKFRVPG